MARTARIELRAEPERQQRIQYAARFVNESVTDFMLGAASLRAEEIISAAQTTVVPADFFDAVWDALSAPPVPNENLVRAFRESRENPASKQA